jgi:hypothetical protein
MRFVVALTFWGDMNSLDTVTAIILCYWEDRFGYISEIIDTLRSNTLPPSNIVVFNNNPDLRDVSFEHAVTINSGENFYCFARHVASLLFHTRYYYFQDDDLVVDNPELLQALSSVLAGHPESVVSLQGRDVIRSVNGDIDFAKTDERETDEDILETDIAFGRLHMCTKGPILRMLNIRHQYGIYSNRGDDIALSLSNKICGFRNYIVRTVGRERNFQVSNGLWRIEGHGQTRRTVASQFLEIMDARSR